MYLQDQDLEFRILSGWKGERGREWKGLFEFCHICYDIRGEGNGNSSSNIIIKRPFPFYHECSDRRIEV